ncbi:metallophosphoesterase family protein [Erythrobacter sp. NE805]|uniref:metallophosphoesterase family protein n=1 Tax=Erythrobacter sp. NE805 TaxID=3389875 RepID=UPI00396B298D
MTSEPTRLFHLSDIHFGLEDREALAWVKREIAAKRPHAVAITGDHTMRARHREWDAATAWITGLDVPVTISIGNHDMPYFNPVERFLTPYKRFEGMKALVERELHLPGLAIVPLKTVRRWQPRINWSKGWVTDEALERCLAALDALPKGTRALVAVHHPLREVGTHGTALTRHGEQALAELAKRDVLGVLSGHVHDPFDIAEPTPEGEVRMIGAGTLSHRLRSTPPSFNEITWDGTVLTVRARNLERVPTREMQIEDVPPNALPPRTPEEPVAPVGRVPPVDPPVH